MEHRDRRDGRVEVDDPVVRDLRFRVLERLEVEIDIAGIRRNDLHSEQYIGGDQPGISSPDLGDHEIGHAHDRRVRELRVQLGLGQTELASQQARINAARQDASGVAQVLAVAASAPTDPTAEEPGVFAFATGKAAYYAAKPTGNSAAPAIRRRRHRRRRLLGHPVGDRPGQATRRHPGRPLGGWTILDQDGRPPPDTVLTATSPQEALALALGAHG